MSHEKHEDRQSAVFSVPLSGAEPMQATRYGDSADVVILSGMDDGDPAAWRPLIDAAGSAEPKQYALLTYAPPQGADRLDALTAVFDCVKETGAGKIVLIGADRGGAASLQLAVKYRDDPRLVAVVAISAPRGSGEGAFLGDRDLHEIMVHALLIDSEFDDGVEQTRDMFAAMEDPKLLTIYPGDRHGTEIFREHEESLARELDDFIRFVL